MSAPPLRPAWATIDLEAARHNVALMRAIAAPADLCVVVKADGYGHGALAMAAAALDGGASWLAVALVEEGVALRAGGIDAPVLVLSEPPLDAMDVLVANRLTPTLYSHAGIEALSKAVQAVGAGPVAVHLKVDTGMHRVGADTADAADLADALSAAPGIEMAGLWTHLAVADGAGADDRAYTEFQLERFEAVRAALAAAGHRPQLVHAANSAGTIAHPRARFDMVRCGIAAYGLVPDPAVAGALSDAATAAGWTGELLRPVMSLSAQVSYVRRLAAGERPSYGRRIPLAADSLVATVPLGYADGVPRRLGELGGAVLIGGRRCLLAGTVTMDQLMVDCGPGADVAVGDEAVLIGTQGHETISAWDWAEALGTISYEVVCGIGPRVPRLTVGGASGQRTD